MTHTAKHTPGPWFSGCKGSKDIQVVADDNSMAPVGTSSLVIAKVNASVEGVEANAALIAAAPAMYETIRKVIEHRAKEYLDNTVEPYCSLVAALAPAEGKQ